MAKIGLQPKRLDKAACLARYFAALDDPTLKIAARFAAGQIFPQWDRRRLHVGSALLIDALAQACAVEQETIRADLVRRGDLGDVARAMWPPTPQLKTRGPTLEQILQFFVDVAAASGRQRKTVMLSAQLGALDGPQAQYLLKLCVAELRIGLAEGAVEDALARSFGQSIEAVQRANMLLGDLGETAYKCRHQQLGSARMRLFHPLKFMLASPLQNASEAQAYVPARFVVEDKYDGIRVQAHVSRVQPAALVEPSPAAGAPQPDGLATAPLHGMLHGAVRVALFTRTLDDITAGFADLVPALAATLSSQHDAFILDGELVPLQDGQILPFASLQRRLGRKKPPSALAEICPVMLVAFDCLFCDGEVLLEAAWTARRAALCRLCPEQLRSSSVGRTSSLLVTDVSALDAMFDAAQARHNEGLMIKDPASPYKPGRRGRDWLKVKRPLATLDVVVTAAQYGAGRRAKMMSDYTFAVRASDADATLLNVGKAYSGLTDQEMAQLTAHFVMHTEQTFAHGKVCLVTPNIVLEVAFDRVQRSARHKSGFALRFPRIVRLRPDKGVHDIDTLAKVASLC